MQATNGILRCVNDFASLILNERQKEPFSFTLRREQTANQQPREDIRRLQIRRCINAIAEAYENAHYFLKLGEPSKAIERLNDATQTAPTMFVDPDLFLLTRLIEIATWSKLEEVPRVRASRVSIPSCSCERRIRSTAPSYAAVGLLFKGCGHQHVVPDSLDVRDRPYRPNG